MRKTKKLIFNKKSVKKFIKLSVKNFIKLSVNKFIKLSFIFIGMCLIAFSSSGCTNKTQRPVEEFTTPVEATITIIEHDISGNDGSDSNNGSENSPDGGAGTTPGRFVENRIDNIPYYFIAIYNGPGNKPGGSEKNLDESFNYLVEIIQRADEYNIKLTLMFSTQSAAYIADNPGRRAMLNEWEKNSHEIINDIGFGFTSCPDCNTGFQNTGPESGINKFISSGTVNGVETKWLACSQITAKEFLNRSIKTFEKLDSNVVYGVAAQSVKEQTPFFYAYLDYLHSLDPEGLNSKTLTSIIEKQLIPEKTIPPGAISG